MRRTALLVALAVSLAAAALVLGRPAAPPPRPAPPPPAAAGDGALALTARLSHPVLPAEGGELFLTADVTGRALAGAPRAGVDLALVLDRSGSMHGEKLEQAKAAARHLVEQLDGRDRLAVVHYGSDVGALGPLPATPAHRAQLLAFIDGISDEGGTNVGAGLEAAARALGEGPGPGRPRRLILLSDGQPTEGRTGPGELTALVRALRARGLSVSALGVGLDFNEDLLQALAETGGGAYAFVADGAGMGGLFARDLRQAATRVAEEVALEVTLADGVELAEVLGHEAAQEGRRVRVRLADVAAGGEERVVVRLRARGGAGGATVPVAAVRLSWSDAQARARAEARAELAARVATRAEEVEAARDREASVRAARASGASLLGRAAEALSAGRRDEARALLQQKARLLEATGALAGPAAVAEDVAEHEAASRAFEQAASDEAVRQAVKAGKARARKDFGKLGSTY